MTLQQQQAKFCLDVARLIQYINLNGYTCTFGDAFRSPEASAIYASRGIGSKNSLHCKRLAIDLNLFKDGVFLSDGKDHEQFGIWWESLDKQNRNGRNFPRPDSNHYEIMEIK